jgi:hypothetical protein
MRPAKARAPPVGVVQKALMIQRAAVEIVFGCLQRN